MPCGNGGGRPGTQSAAEWVRTAFHDMATHDAAAGTGGLDASIMYEVSREENEGAAFNNTLADLAEFVSPDVSASDLIALGVVAAVASCGGPRIPYRAGRVDAGAAGPPGVPMPTDPLDKTVAAFNRMGFTRSEMIGLVACGHSIGQVHSVDFPDLVDGAPAAGNVAHFDRTPARFDTAVVGEYLSGDGANPLVFGANETTNSDKRVFSADGTNATMRALAGPAGFASTCGALLGRMIDTVPRGVRLTDPIELQQVKPYVDRLQLDANSPTTTTTTTIAFEGRVRVRTTGRDAEPLSVSLDLVDRDGRRLPAAVPATRVRQRGGQSLGFFGEVFTWFDFATRLDADAGLGSFIIKVHNATDNSTTTFDNNSNSNNYPAQSDLLFMYDDSCLDSRIVDGSNNMTLRVTAAVRGGAGQENKDTAPPVLNLAHRVQQPNVTLPRLGVEGVRMRPLGTTRGPYALYSADVPIEAKGWSTSFNLVLPRAGGDVVSPRFRTSRLSQSC